MRSRHSPLPLAALLVVASLTHFLYFTLNTDVVSDDSHTYLGPARQLAAGNGFTNVYGHPETRRTPGYPLFLAPLVGSLDAVRVVQHLLAIALVFAVYRFTRAAGESGSVAILAGLLLAIDQPSIHHADAILTETLFTPFVFACAVLLYVAASRASIRFAAVAGLIGGVAVLIRPIGLYFFAAGALYLVFVARRAAMIAAFVLVFALPPLAWSWRNEQRAGHFTISTITSWSLLCDRAAATLAIGDEGDFRANFFRHRRELLARAGDPPTAANPNRIPRPGELFHPERYSPIAREVLLAHPFGYAKVWVRALGWTLLGGGATWLQRVTGLPPDVLRAVVLAYNALMVVLAAIGLFVLNRRLALLIALVIAYYLVTASVGEPSSRFRVPVVPLMSIAAAAGAVRLARWRRPAAVEPAPSAAR